MFWSVLYIALRRVLELVLLRSRSDETKELEIARCQSMPGQGGPLGVRYRGPLARHVCGSSVGRAGTRR